MQETGTGLAPSGQVAGGPSKDLSRKSNGQVFVRLPLVWFRLAPVVAPPLPVKTPDRSPKPLRSYAIEYPPRIVACSGSPSSVRANPCCAFGRHARPTFGAK